jgi:ABC-type transporter Mla MlaB component
MTHWLSWRSLPAWQELQDTTPGSGYSKEALKELIERKRANDFVRKREFAHLRRLRRREPVSSSEAERQTSSPGSLSVLDERNRAATLRKINEIEAQMSRLWGEDEASAATSSSLRGAQRAPQPSLPAAGGPPSIQALPPADRSPPAFQGLDHPSVSGLDQPVPGPDTGLVTGPSGPLPEMAPGRSGLPSGDDEHVWNDASALSGLSAVPTPGAAGPSASTWQAVPMPADPGPAAWRPAGSGGPVGLGNASASRRTGVLPQRGVLAARAILTPPVPAPDHLADPDLEDAAIRYANGDQEGALQSLQAALESALEAAAHSPPVPSSSVLQVLVRMTQTSKAPSPQLVETWLLACVDLARATGQQAVYERVAVDWTGRFAQIYTHLASHPVPRWFSIPERVGPDKGAVRLHRPAPPALRLPDWRSPVRLDAPAVQALQARYAEVQLPSQPPAVMDENTAALVLDWQALRVITAEAVPLLAALMAQWCEAPAGAALGLVFRGPASLERALLALTHGVGTGSGAGLVDRASAGPLHWRLRMDALRLMRLRDAFELAALDYGVSHETQAPAWREPAAVCLLQGPSDPQEAEAEDIRANWDTPEDPAWNGAGPSASLEREALGQLDVWIGAGAEASDAAVEGSEAQPVRVDLYGEICGDATEVLTKLDKAIAGRSYLVASCADLIRVDFPAAGGLLNWVADQRSQGRQVQLRDVHRLVAAFFNVIGISEHARVVPRTD